MRPDVFRLAAADFGVRPRFVGVGGGESLRDVNPRSVGHRNAQQVGSCIREQPGNPVQGVFVRNLDRLGECIVET